MINQRGVTLVFTAIYYNAVIYETHSFIIYASDNYLFE